MNTAALVFHPRRKPRLARLGDWMAEHRRLLLGAQWVIVLAYAVLLLSLIHISEPTRPY